MSWVGMDFLSMYEHLMPLDELWAKDAAIRDIHPGALVNARWQGDCWPFPSGSILIPCTIIRIY